MKAAEVIPHVGHSVAIFPKLAAALKSREASILLVQLLYWTPKKGEWVRKNLEAIKKATVLTDWEVRVGRDRLTNRGILVEYYNRESGHLEFQINMDRLDKVWNDHLRLSQMAPASVTSAPASVTDGHHTRANTRSNKEVIHTDRNGFFEKIETSTFDDIAAKKFSEALAKKRKLYVHANLKNWSKWIAKIRRDYQVPNSRIKEVIQYHISTLGSKYCLSIYSAETLHKRFIELDASMDKEKPKVEKIVLTPFMEKIVARLKQECTWPLGSAVQLPKVVSESQRNYADWRRKCWELMKTISKDKPHRDYRYYHSFYEKLEAAVFTENFVWGWFYKINQKLIKWPEWSGHLASYVVSEEHTDFQALGYQASQEYSGSGALWQKFYNSVNCK